MTKQSKRENKIDKEAKKNDNIIIAILLLSFSGALIGIALTTTSTPPITKTLYITSNHFPIKTPSGNGTATEYVFYGTLQPNGTECISSAVIVTYPFNYTSQSFSLPQNITVTNPKEIADMYYSSLISNSMLTITNIIIHIPNGYTLLCPDIINATR